MEIKAVFFDLDDTLHDHQAPFAKALLDTFHHWPSIPDLNTAYKKFRYYSDYFWKDYTQGNISLEQLRINRIIATLENLGIGISEQEAVLFQENYENNLNTPILFTEVPSVFDALKRKEIKIGLITNGPITHQQNKISQLGLQDFINEELIFISDQVGFAKPNPQLFHTAAKKIDLPAEHLLYVGDTWENDVVGPISAGWNAIWFNHRSREPLTDHKPLAEINKLSSLLNLLNL